MPPGTKVIVTNNFDEKSQGKAETTTGCQGH